MCQASEESSSASVSGLIRPNVSEVPAEIKGIGVRAGIGDIRRDRVPIVDKGPELIISQGFGVVGIQGQKQAPALRTWAGGLQQRCGRWLIQRQDIRRPLPCSLVPPGCRRFR